LLNRFQEPAFALWRFRKLSYATSQLEEEQEAELVEIGRPAIEQPNSF
jgi:hypothetical protein